jgi:hypothetical protein
MKNDSLKIVLIVAVIAIAGYFLYQNFAKTDADQQGAVISGTSTTTSNPGIANCTPNVSFGDSACVITFPDCSMGVGSTINIISSSGATSQCCKLADSNSCVQNKIVSGKPSLNTLQYIPKDSTTGSVIIDGISYVAKIMSKTTTR